MKTSTICLKVSVVILIMGMLWGIHMGISGNHAAMPAHAHLNLLGWVSLFLFGLFYRQAPAIDGSLTSRIHVFVWIAATLVQAYGVYLITAGHPGRGEPIAGGSALVLLADAVLFGWLVWRS